MNIFSPLPFDARKYNAEQALAFDGVDDKIVFPDLSFVDLGNAFSIEGVFRLAAGVTDGVLCSWGTGTLTNAIIFGVQSGVLFFALRASDSTGTHFISSSRSIDPEKTYHVAVTTTGAAPVSIANTKLYINGKDDTGSIQGSSGVATVARGSTILGDQPATGQELEGVLTMISIYDIELSKTQIQRLRSKLIVPLSLRDNCQFRYLSDNLFRDDSGTLKAFDSVELYNKQKAVVDSNLEGIFQGKTVSELGLDYLGRQNSFFDFYKPVKYNENSYNTNLTQGQGGVFPNFNTIGTGDCTIVLTILAPAASGNTRLIESVPTNYPLYFRTIVTQNNVQIAGTSSTATVIFGSIGIEENEKLTVKVEFTGGNRRIVKAYNYKKEEWFSISDVTITSGYNFTSNISSFATSASNFNIVRKAICTRILTDDEAIDLDSVATIDKLEDYVFNNDFGIDAFRVVAGSNFSWTKSGSFPNINQGGLAYTKSMYKNRFSSLYPKIVQCLDTPDGWTGKIDKSTPFNLATTGDGYTFVFISKLKTGLTYNSQYHLHFTNQINFNYRFEIGSTVAGNRQRYRYFSAAGVLEATSTDEINFTVPTGLGEELHIMAFTVYTGVALNTPKTYYQNKLVETGLGEPGYAGFDAAGTTNDLFIRNFDDGATGRNNMIAIADMIFSTRLNNAEIAEIVSSFNKPNPAYSAINRSRFSSLACYYQYQEDSFYEGTTNPMQYNIANPGTFDLEITGGVTGATAADKLADLRTNLIDLNTLY